MSRIGKTPISLPKGVTVAQTNSQVNIVGPKGQLQVESPKNLQLEVGVDAITVQTKDEAVTKATHGLYRAILQNAITGVTQGWTKQLELVGVGYRVLGGGQELTLNVGFSHPVKFSAPAGITFQILDNTKFVVVGVDKQLVGEVAARIRSTKPPEPYKGKGIRYAGEVVRKKAGKAVKAVGAAA